MAEPYYQAHVSNATMAPIDKEHPFISGHHHPDDPCNSHSPNERLSLVYKVIFGSSIMFTAMVCLILNLFVIITLVWARRKGVIHRLTTSNRFQGQSSSSSQSSGKKSGQTKSSSSGGGRSSQEGQTNASDQGLIRPVQRNVPNLSGRQNNGLHGKPIKYKYSNTHVSFISMSTSVIIYSSFCVPGLWMWTIDNENKDWVDKFLFASFHVAPIASSFLHLLMAIDRYLAIKQIFNLHSYWYRRHYRFCIVMLWVCSVAIYIPFIWYNTYSENVRKTMTLARLTFTFSLPTLATLVLYIKVAWQLSEYKTLQQEFLVQNAELLKKNKTIITKILLLAFTHFLCWFPLSVVESLNDLFPSLFHRCDTDIHHYFYYRIKSILILITSLSGVIYPILYCFVSSQFKKILIEAWVHTNQRYGSRRNRRTSSISSVGLKGSSKNNNDDFQQIDDNLNANVDASMPKIMEDVSIDAGQFELSLNKTN